MRFALFWALIMRINQGAIIIASSEVLKPINSGIASYGKTTTWRLVSVLTALLMACIPTPGQNQSARQSPTQNSELGRENLSRVSASAGEIKAVIIRDVGIMVELKRWVAKDATDHGQIITDADVTNDAIFDRLERTLNLEQSPPQLVQRYGYLVPQMNPDSEQAKEQAFLIRNAQNGLLSTKKRRACNRTNKPARPPGRSARLRLAAISARRMHAADLAEATTITGIASNNNNSRLGGQEQIRSAEPTKSANPSAPRGKSPTHAVHADWRPVCQRFPAISVRRLLRLQRIASSSRLRLRDFNLNAQSSMKMGSGSGEESDTFTGKSPRDSKAIYQTSELDDAGMYGASGTGTSLEAWLQSRRADNRAGNRHAIVTTWV